MKNYTLPLIALGIGVIYYFGRLKVAGENLKVNLKNISTKKSSGLSLPKIILDFEIQNVTNNSFVINGIVGDVYVNNNYLANISNLIPAKISAKSIISYPVTLQTSVLDALPIVRELIKAKGKRNLNITADLSLNVNNILVPYKIEKKIL